MEKIAEWDVAEVLETKEDIIACLEVAFQQNDTEFLLEALKAVARSGGIAEIARELGADRNELYKLLVEDEEPSLSAVLKLLDILHLRLKLVKKSD
jgi:probable addiction module antidote protein